MLLKFLFRFFFFNIKADTMDSINEADLLLTLDGQEVRFDCFVVVFEVVMFLPNHTGYVKKWLSFDRSRTMVFELRIFRKLKISYWWKLRTCYTYPYLRLKPSCETTVTSILPANFNISAVFNVKYFKCRMVKRDAVGKLDQRSYSLLWTCRSPSTFKCLTVYLSWWERRISWSCNDGISRRESE